MEQQVNRSVNLLVTNYCNVNCESCSQLCNLFKTYKPQERWHIPLEQFEKDVSIMIAAKVPGTLGIFGGEPTVHPQWDRLLEVIRSYPNQSFKIHSNNTHPDKLPDLPNVRYEISEKTEPILFVAVTKAPIDELGNPDRTYYWNNSQKFCPVWRSCRRIVYDDRLYLCEVSAAFDRMLLGKANWHLSAGWDIHAPNPFTQTSKQIKEQAVKFCYRCGSCLGHKYYQLNNLPSVISPTNLELIQ